MKAESKGAVMAVETWARVEKKALWALEHAQQLSPGGRVERMRPLLRLWTYSSEGTYTSWTILAPVEAGGLASPMVREVVWRRRRDEERMASVNRKHLLRTKPQVTIRFRDAELSSDELGPFLKTAARLFVPKILTDDPEPDSDACGIEGYGALTYLRMEWQGPAPVEWAQPVAWVTDLRELLVASLIEREEADGRPPAAHPSSPP
jgi:hypothetical protein